MPAGEAWKRAHGYTPSSPGWGMDVSELEEFEGQWPNRMVELNPKDSGEESEAPLDQRKKK